MYHLYVRIGPVKEGGRGFVFRYKCALGLLGMSLRS